MKVLEHSISNAIGLQCANCGTHYSIIQIQSFANCCNQPLLVRYSNDSFDRNDLLIREHTMWRYREMLPVFHPHNIVSLGEGWTPLHSLEKTAAKTGIQKILLKDEAVNPTASFKARGISVAVSKAKELGIEHCIIPTAGNAGSALSAYCAKAGMKATVIMPAHTPEVLKEECNLFGAELIIVDGLLDACGKKAKQIQMQTNAFDISTMKEPYRLEGKKTMGYELAEQLSWELPDVIIYPTGGGTGLIGMWKAFHEMQELHWITNKLPRMVIVQTQNCSPMIQLFQNGSLAENFSALPSIAYGLTVPFPFAKDLILQVLWQSDGTALTVTEEEMENSIEEIAASEGLLLCPEGAATYAGLKKLVEKNWIKEDESVLLFNTGSWYKYH